MYARSNQFDAPLRAEAIVARFRDLAKKGALPIKPDEYTYSQLLKSWITSGRKDGIDQAVTCFYWMRDIANSGDAAATPDVVKVRHADGTNPGLQFFAKSASLTKRSTNLTVYDDHHGVHSHLGICAS